MLSFLRKKRIMKRILWVLAIIIIPCFILWGAGSLTKRRLPYGRYIGIIDNKKIDVDSFIKSLQNVRIGLFLNYFNQPLALDKVQKDRKLLNRIAWENLILNHAAKKENITVSDKEVVGFVTVHPLFTRGGAFDDKLYNYILKNSLGLTPRAFEESVRDFLVNIKFRNNIIKNVTVSDEELKKFYKNEFEKAKACYIVIDKIKFKGEVEVHEDEITSFYEKNKKYFVEPEKVVLQYIAFPHKEKDTKDSVLTKLNTSYEKLKRNPRKMENLAKKLNLVINETAPFSQEEIAPEIGEIKDIGSISFKMRPLLDILPIIDEKELGTSYIIMVKERIPAGIKSEDKVSSYIIDILKDEKAIEFAKKEADKLYEKIVADKQSLKEVAASYGLKLLQTDLITRFDYIEEVGESYKVVDTAFTLKPGEVSKPIMVRKGFSLIEPVEFEFIDENKFEKEKEDYRNKVLSIKKIKALEDWFNKAKISTSLNVDLDKI